MAILKTAIVQAYTGPGKGKTTAALGLAWRMLGRGGHVYFCQFLKPADLPTGESLFAQHLAPRLTFERLEDPWDMRTALTDPQQHRRMADAIARKLDHVREALVNARYDLVVLDEILYCLSLDLLPLDTLQAILDARPATTELVLTGRDAPAAILDRCDLVTRMEELKHPYTNNLPARPGIEY